MIQTPAGTSTLRLLRLVQMMAHDTDTCWDLLGTDEHMIQTPKASEISTDDGT